MLAGLSDKKSGSDDVESSDGAWDGEKPRRIKRMRTRIGSWFGMPKRGA